MVDPSALYPQPVNPMSAQPALLQSPMQALSFMGGAQQLQARNAIGSALQGAIGPDGNFDPSAALTAIKNNPVAAYGAPEAIGSVLQMRGQNTANATAALNLGVSNNAAIAAILAPYANQKALSNEDQYNIKAKLAAAGVDPATVAAADVSAPVATLKAARLGAVQAMGAGAAASPVNAGPDASGAPQVTPLASTIGTGPRPVGMAPGAPEAIAANRAEFVNDQTAGAARMANVRQLQTALPLISQLSSSNFGPGSPEFAKIKGALTTMGVVDPSTSDLQVRQEAGKYLLKYASGAIQAGRSDNALSAAIGSNPNLDLTQPANMALIKNQIGMDRMDAALPLVAPSDTSQYKDFKSKFYQSADPRAFSFDIMTPAERAQVQTSLGAPSTASKPNPAYDKFVRSYQMAKQAGMLAPPTPGGQ